MGSLTRRKKLPQMVFAFCLTVCLVAGILIRPGMDVQAAASADGETLTAWESTTGRDTRNIGRIWTDKSVSLGESDGDDFTITLSALSSTVKLQGETALKIPLDIVLVLDVSGSMKDRIGNSYQSSKTKMTALKEAVNQFIDTTKDINAEITDAKDQHRIGIVTYSTEATIRKELTLCDAANAQSMHSIVNGLNANGATAADYAMNKTEQVLKGARADAKKIVIFFTDGEPNHYNGFDNDVANAAIQKAKNIKADGAEIYSIGVFAAANPSNTTEKFNAYMHGMSSNYPNATAFNALGERAKDEEGNPKNYYKAASNASELNRIFEEIASEITEDPAKLPTQITEGTDPSLDGYITFTDKLGEYMQVTSVRSIIFADQTYALTEKKTSGTIDTYVFSHDVSGNILYPNGNLDKIIIKVQRFEEKKEGDLVTVKIPGSLIPLRYYNVQSDANGLSKMQITDASPIRVIYGTVLKEGVREQLEEPDDVLKAYIEKHTSSDGKQVHFYANDYDKTTGTGTVSAEFIPASTNPFYYFTEDTLLYTDANCTQVAKYPHQAASVYYFKVRYFLEGESQAREEHIPVSGSHELFTKSAVKCTEKQDLYIEKGTPRLVGLNLYPEEKNVNITNTASYVIRPEWNSYGNKKEVIAFLGNNGMLSEDLPGKLIVRKHAAAVTGHTLPENDSYDFTITLKNVKEKETFRAQIFDKNNEMSGESFYIKSGDRLTLKAEQSCEIYGLPDGADYAIEEIEKPHYTIKAKNEKGTIHAGEAQEVIFDNEYKAAPVTVEGSKAFLAKKEFEGPDQTSGWLYVEEAFELVLKGLENAPMQKGVEGQEIIIKRNSNDVFHFGDITYDTPGTYVYTISEKRPDQETAGISYSQAVYEITVTIKDIKGELTPDITIKQLYMDNGIAPDKQVITDLAVITNRYDAKEASTTASAIKNYVDHTGSRPLENGMFQFKVRPVGNQASLSPIPEGVILDEEGCYYVGNTGNDISIGQLQFKAQHANRIYEYEISEVIPEEAVLQENGTYLYQGMTYDPTIYTVQFRPIIMKKDGNQVIQVAPQYVNAPNGIVFNNSYEAEPAVLEGNQAIHGYKRINGRDMLEEESFTFKLSPADETTKAAMQGEKPVITIEVGENGKAGTLSEVKGAQNNKDTAFYFGNAIFRKPGEYRFEIEEIQIPESDENGMTYDRHKASVLVTVSDKNGKLFAKATYEDEHFVNRYQASMQFDGIEIAKTLEGKTMNPKEFSFRLQGAADTDISFENEMTKQSGEKEIMTMLTELTFNQDDVGKTFAYTLDEIEPEEAKKDGVTYDQSQYLIEIRVLDDGKGNLRTISTAIMTKNENGETCNTPIGTVSSQEQKKLQVGFVNRYKAEPAVLPGNTNLAVTKILNGRNWTTEDTFTFTITSKNTQETAVTMKDPVEIMISDQSEAHKEAFGDIVFDAPGTYYFIVKESIPENAIPGVQYDDSEKQLVVIVTDLQNGKLKAELSSESDPLTFTNSYEADQYTLSGETYLHVKKELTGRNWKSDDAFTFTLEAINETKNKVGTELLMPEETSITIDNANETKTAFFGDIVFCKEGEYDFVIREVLPEDDDSAKEGIQHAGITYDADHERHIHVKVTDNGKGMLTGEVTGGEQKNLTFHNVYGYAPVELEGKTHLPVTKVLNGRDWFADDAFTFTLTGKNESGFVLQGGNTVTITGSDESKSGHFGNILFSQPGIFTFTITENAHQITNVSHDKHVQTICVTVEDDQNGKLKIAAVNYENAEAGGSIFTNTYTPDPASITIQGKKEIAGRSFRAEDVYEFTISALDENAPMPDITTVKNNSDGTITFPAISYEKPGTYRYEMTETTCSVPGITKDSAVVQATVQVSYDATSGQLSASVSYQKGEQTGSSFTFVNTYAAAPVNLSASVTGTKQVTPTQGNHYEMKGGEFEFDLIPSSDNPASDPVAKQTVNNDASGTIVFLSSETTYTESGIYKYTVLEKSNGIPGIRYDNTGYVITVTVTDDPATGKLNAVSAISTTSGEDVEQIYFENGYDPASTSVVIKGLKQLEGRGINAGEFQFELHGIKAAMKYPKDVVESEAEEEEIIPEKAPEEIPEETAEEAPEEIPEETAEEAPEEIPEETAEEAPEEIPEETAEEAPEEIPEETAEEAPEEIQEETPEIAPEEIPEEISEEVTQYEIIETLPPMPESAIASNDAAGGFVFGEIPYEVPGTYVYEVTEKNLGADGITYDGSVYEVIITVEDVEGELAATTEIKKAGAPADQILFNNQYKPLATNLNLSGQKILKGAAIDGYQFNFELLNKDGAVIDTTSNNKDGSFSFNAMTYDTEGTYYYTIREAADAIKGITFDTRTCGVEVTVSDQNGRLVAVPKYYRGQSEIAQAEFVNTYHKELMITAKKTLTGRTLKDGEFTFVLKNAKGEIIATVSNTASGEIHFPTMSYTIDILGTNNSYEEVYTIEEIAGKDEKIVYDKTKYMVSVLITESDGVLQTQVIYPNGKEPVFANKVKEEPIVPASDNTPIPNTNPTPAPRPQISRTVKTGDETDIALFVVLIFISTATGAVVWFKRKR